MTIAGTLFQSILRHSNPHFVPIANRRLTRWAMAHPTELAQRVDAATGSAIRYFETATKIDLAALFLLGRLYRTGLEPRLRFIEHRIASGIAATPDPHWRLLDPAYTIPAGTVTGDSHINYNHPVLKLMIRCIYADRAGDGADCLESLSSLSDGGGYETTHVAIGGLILREFNAAPLDRIEALIQPVEATLISAQQHDRAGDLFAERIAVLQWLSRQSSVETAWIVRLVNAQHGNGGWAAGPSLRRARANQHTSALALVSLVQWRTHGMTKSMAPFWQGSRS